MSAHLSHAILLMTIAVALAGSLRREAHSDHPEPSVAGHSAHGEAFDDGPRQAAYLMSGMGNVHWEINTKSPMAQRFFDQGVCQLHGFWYFEAERSFRQVAAVDSDCAMAYWGMARANALNEKRARGFIAEAVKRLEHASDLESKLINAFADRLKEDAKGSTKKSRMEAYSKALEEIALDHPDHIEIKAMLVLQLWESEKDGSKIQSRIAIDAILDKIFAANPRHPAHHFRIHLWDNKSRDRALSSAAACGPAAPGIAHMWHMPGHTYTGLKRYHDAAWQQEASARVDHAHMIRDRVMPDQIHNFAHNNEWLIRTWTKTGQAQRGLELAENMSSLPRHPDYNTLEKGSANFGRKRLISVTTTYGLWDKLLALADSPCLATTSIESLNDERLALMAIAHAMLGHDKHSNEFRMQLDERLTQAAGEFEKLAVEVKGFQSQKPRPPLTRSSGSGGLKSSSNPPKLKPPALVGTIALEKLEWNEPDAKPDPRLADFADDKIKDWTKDEKAKVKEWKKLDERLRSLRQRIIMIGAFQAAARSDYADAVVLARYAGKSIPEHYRFEWLSEAGYRTAALDKAKTAVKNDSSDVPILANGIWLAWQADDRKQAKLWAEDFRKVAFAADTNLAMFQQLNPIFKALGLPDNPAVSPEPASDIGDRPNLDSLGPPRWSPYAAPGWSLENGQGETISSKGLHNRPHVMIFYLGLGCLHCVEQLQTMSPMVEQFKAAGIDVVAISTEDRMKLREGLTNYGKTMNIPLYANPEMDVFKSYRCFDDFENQPLHGTYLVDADGKVRWQDIGPDPFMELEFLLQEAKRLLAHASNE